LAARIFIVRYLLWGGAEFAGRENTVPKWRTK